MKIKFLSLNQRTLEQHGVVSAKDLWAKAQEDGAQGLAVDVSVSMTKEVDGDTKKFHAVFSTDTEDRHRERVFQNFDLKAFKKNPVYLDSHIYWGIEYIIGKVSSISVKDGKLQGTIEFATKNPKGQLAQDLAEDGFLNTSSIGFIPKEFDQEGNILKSELLEISAVSIPANPEALYDHEKGMKQEDAPVIEDTPAPEPVEKQEVVGIMPSPHAVAASILDGIKSERTRALEIAAREVNKLAQPGAQKRAALKAIRELLEVR